MRTGLPRHGAQEITEMHARLDVGSVLLTIDRDGNRQGFHLELPQFPARAAAVAKARSVRTPASRCR
jgi:hypothetical protein